MDSHKRSAKELYKNYILKPNGTNYAFLQLIEFINQIVNQYFPSPIFICAPDKAIKDRIAEGMINGIELDDICIQFFESEGKLGEYQNKQWIIQSNDKYYFKITPIGMKLKGIQYQGTLTYYRSDETIGVENNCRILLLITPPFIPKNPTLWLAHEYINNGYFSELSLSDLNTNLYLTNCASNFIQTIGRVKDPLGIEKIGCFLLGI